MIKCLSCQKPILKGKYCSVQCQADMTKSISVDLWLRKEITGHAGNVMNVKPFVRKYMIDKAGNKCSKCNWNMIHPISGKPPLELNHIDGDASNTYEDNLEVLCPNCHSLTPNYKNRNRNGQRTR